MSGGSVIARDLAGRDVTMVWCDIVLEALWRAGVVHICLAPGSRSAPLALALNRHGRFTVHTHFDERGLGFLALGLARQSGQPVVLVTTSGTAVANLSPALHEARENGVGLIVLSADRPAELLGCGANQTLTQPGIFAEAVARTFAIPVPDTQLPLRWLLQTMDEAVAVARRPDQAVVHINQAFRDPLYGSIGTSLHSSCADHTAWLAAIESWWQGNQPLCQWHQSEPVIPSLPPINDTRVVVLAGQLDDSERQAVLALVQKTGWLLVADSQSGLHGHSLALACADMALLRPDLAAQLHRAERVIQFGRRLLGKQINQWLKHWQAQTGAEHWYIDRRHDRHDPQLTVSHRFCCSVTGFCQQLQTIVPVANRAWSEQILAMAQQLADGVVLRPSLTAEQPVAEIAAVRSLRAALEQAGNCQLFLGNSMPIRYFDSLTTAQQGADLPVWANRGISGIDGLLATACGHHAASQRRTAMVIGDLSLLHDLNSLALVAHYKLLVVLLNNSGGTIFNLFPVPEQSLANHFRIDHRWQAQGAATMFGLDYQQPKTMADYQGALESALENDNGCIVELLLPSSGGTDEFAQLKEQVRMFNLAGL